MMHSKYQRLSPRLVELDGKVQAVMGTDQGGGYVFHEELETCRERLKAANTRLATLADSELELQTKIYELKAEMEGPGEYATWKDAAVTERSKRVTAEAAIAKLEERNKEACELVKRWLDVSQPHDWSGWQTRVEAFLGINTPEPIPKNVAFDESTDEFYDTFYDFRTMGDEFRKKWFTRYAEFPVFRRNCIGTWP